MKQMTQEQLSQLIQDSRQLLSKLDLTQAQTTVKRVQKISSQADFWQRADAQDQIQTQQAAQSLLDEHQQLQQAITDLSTLLELQQETSDDQAKQDLDQEIHKHGQQLAELNKQLELRRYLNHKYDTCGAILSIHPGQGGTEAMDWAAMLKRMYWRYFERKNWPHRLVSETKGEDAGIKEVVFEIDANYAYGYLKGEQGTHRLVRLSPFNADHLRQTSFALVEVLPIVKADQDLVIKDDELTWNFTRSGGAGGQSVNKTNSAVELTHLPTGIVVKCREERSQIQNRERALKILKAKLAKLEEEKIDQQLAQEKGHYQPASWGSQIRNYVLHPYQLVKDTRTQVETSQTQAVLDGDLDQFILAWLRR